MYDAAFSYRDYKAEVKFLMDCYKRHASGQPPDAPVQSVLELGCGPARHLLGLYKAGLPVVMGLDASDDMLTYARSLASAAPAPSTKGKGNKAAAASHSTVQLVKGDMASFDLPQKNLDMVLCLLGTLSHLLENSQAISCFRAVSAHLRPGGLFLVELAHPGDLFDGSLIVGDGGKEMWEAQFKGNKLLVEWGADFDNFDPRTQILYRTVALNVLKGEEVLQSLEEVVAYRQYTVRELELIAEMTGFSVEALYGEMDLAVAVDDEEAYRMVAVLRKRE